MPQQPGRAKLCLKKRNDSWVPLSVLRKDPGLSSYFLTELHLLQGLCAGFNGLTLQTIAALYPFRLCYNVITDSQVSSEVRASMCVRARQVKLLHEFSKMLAIDPTVQIEEPHEALKMACSGARCAQLKTAC